MLEIKNTKVYGLEESIIRSGYPMQVGEPLDIDSFIKFDIFHNPESPANAKAIKRASKLGKVKSGTGHDNYLKGIIVQFDLKYPQYFTPQLQRYNWIDIISSQSKMHKLTSNKDVRNNCNKYVTNSAISNINNIINIYNTFDGGVNVIDGKVIETKAECFQYVISNLPMGYELWMGISTNYLQLKTIYFQRKNHKLEEWKYFCKWVEELPMFKKLIL